MRREARARTGLARYSKARFAALAAELPKLLTTPANFSALPKVLADVGVILVYVEALPGAKIDGGAFMLGGHPVVGISGRRKRLDKARSCGL